jgi:signal transduction histidine kinase
LRAQTIRITATRLWERSGDFVFALAEMQAFSEGKNIALKASVTSADDTLTPAWTREHLVDGHSSSGLLVDESAWLADLSHRRQITDDLAQLDPAHAIALGIAQARLAWLLVGTVTIVIVMGWLAVWRSRRSRHREMKALRQRISRDLHDDIGSHLGSIRLMSELAMREGGDTESLEEIHRLAGEAAESMRGIIWLVREGDAPKLTSLVEAMRQSAAALLIGIDWNLDLPSIDNTATASLEFHRQVFLLYREAVHNIARHAQATQVTIEITWQAKHFILRIKDNGCGFDAAAVTAGNGLANLRHRAEVLGSKLRITSEPGKGTRIILEAALS